MAIAHYTLKNERGNMLVGTLVAAAIMGIMAAVFATMMSNYARDSQSLTQKMDILGLDQFLVGALSNAGVCGCTLNPALNTTDASKLTFNSNSASTISLTNIYSACPTGSNPTAAATAGKVLPGSTNVYVKTITLTQPAVTATTASSYQATLTVNFDNTKLVTPRQPVTIPINVSANVSTAAQSTFTGCAFGAPPAAFPGSTGSGPAPASSGLSPFNNCQLEPTQTCPSGKVVKNCYGVAANQSQQCYSNQGLTPGGCNMVTTYGIAMGTPGTIKNYNGSTSAVCNVPGSSTFAGSSSSSTQAVVGIYECCDP